jgi:signal transduction histidine kinase
VFGNLVGNAVKFCQPGAKVSVAGSVHENGVEIVVSDSGPGIAESELPHIFDRYWSAKRHQAGGTGLGLYISKGIIDAHGGRIWADSKVGAGSTFHVVLPLAAA